MVPTAECIFERDDEYVVRITSDDGIEDLGIRWISGEVVEVLSDGQWVALPLSPLASDVADIARELGYGGRPIELLALQVHAIAVGIAQGIEMMSRN